VFVEARLVDFGCINTAQPIVRSLQLERIAINHYNLGGKAWPNYCYQKRRNESAHLQPR
jgi:hypothetical protein